MSQLKHATAAAAVGELSCPEPDTVQRQYCFGTAFIGFQGHFPGAPILPALVQILAGVTLAEAWRGQPLNLAAIDNAKFLLPVYPERLLQVECRERRKDDHPVCEVRITLDGKLASSFVLRWTEGTPAP
ncbi:MAG: 3-hydroxyacyl-ACP dehydratase [bacterium]